MRKNPEQEDVIEIDENADPSDFPLWYQQFMKLSEKQRAEISVKALQRIREVKPDTWTFIKNFKCKLVGVSPNISYTLLAKSDGDLDVTFVHAFSMPTLLYWCPAGKFGLFVNCNLDYNDTVLNRVKGNAVDSGIKGFTG